MAAKWSRLTSAEDLPDRGDSVDTELEGNEDMSSVHVPSQPRGIVIKQINTAERTTNGLSPVEENSDGILAVEIGRVNFAGGMAGGDGLSQSTRSVAGSSREGPPRTQPFTSGFSDLSVNSLPDMSLLRNPQVERPRSKSHQHDSPPRVLTVKSPALQLSHSTIQVESQTCIQTMFCHNEGHKFVQFLPNRD